MADQTVEPRNGMVDRRRRSVGFLSGAGDDSFLKS